MQVLTIGIPILCIDHALLSIEEVQVLQPTS